MHIEITLLYNISITTGYSGYIFVTWHFDNLSHWLLSRNQHSLTISWRKTRNYETKLTMQEKCEQFLKESTRNWRAIWPNSSVIWENLLKHLQLPTMPGKEIVNQLQKNQFLFSIFQYSRDWNYSKSTIKWTNYILSPPCIRRKT